MVRKQQITDFLSNAPIAAAGVSRNKKKFGYAVFKELREKGLDLIPINPHAEDIDGVPVVKEIKDLPENINALYVVTKKDQTLAVVEAAIEKGIKHIWIQQKSETPEAISALAATDTNLITRQCILMHHQPHSIHKFHGSVKRFFGTMPK